jgi:hypothetical protein
MRLLNPLHSCQNSWCMIQIIVSLPPRYYNDLSRLYWILISLINLYQVIIWNYHCRHETRCQCLM